MQVMYSSFDSGNFYVIPGSPAEVLRSNVVLKNNNGVEMRQKYGFNPDDFIIAVVGSHFLYSGIMLEHAVMLKALAPLLKQFRSKNETLSRLKVQILSSNLTDAYKMAIEVVILIVLISISSCIYYLLGAVPYFDKQDDATGLKMSLCYTIKCESLN
jgi:hypothetical protein